MDLIDQAAEIAATGDVETAWQVLVRWSKEDLPIWAAMMTAGPAAQ